MLGSEIEFKLWLTAISQESDEGRSRELFNEGIKRWPQWGSVKILKTVDRGGLIDLDKMDLERTSEKIAKGNRFKLVGLFPTQTPIMYLSANKGIYVDDVIGTKEMFSVDRPIILDSNVIGKIVGYCHHWFPEKFGKIGTSSVYDESLDETITDWIETDMDFNMAFFICEYIAKNPIGFRRGDLRRTLRKIAHLQAFDKRIFKENRRVVPDRKYLEDRNISSWKEYLNIRSNISIESNLLEIESLARECLLWKTISLVYDKGSEAEKVSDLMKYMFEVCGGFWTREALLCYDAIVCDSKDKPGWIKRITTGMKWENIVSHISSTSWDVTLVRFCENFPSIPGISRRSIVIPYFFTYDKVLIDYVENMRIVMLASWNGLSVPFYEQSVSDRLNDSPEIVRSLTSPRPPRRVKFERDHQLRELELVKEVARKAWT